MNERKELLLAEYTSVAELADLMGVDRGAVIRAGFERGLLLTVFQELRFEECRALAAQFGCLARRRDP